MALKFNIISKDSEKDAIDKVVVEVEESSTKKREITLEIVDRNLGRAEVALSNRQKNLADLKTLRADIEREAKKVKLRAKP